MRKIALMVAIASCLLVGVAAAPKDRPVDCVAVDFSDGAYTVICDLPSRLCKGDEDKTVVDCEHTMLVIPKDETPPSWSSIFVGQLLLAQIEEGRLMAKSGCLAGEMEERQREKQGGYDSMRQPVNRTSTPHQCNRVISPFMESLLK